MIDFSSDLFMTDSHFDGSGSGVSTHLFVENLVYLFSRKARYSLRATPPVANGTLVRRGSWRLIQPLWGEQNSPAKAFRLRPVRFVTTM